MKTYTRTELSALFGSPFSELKRLGRHGAFRRLGANRYLLDYQLSLQLLRGQDKALSSGAFRRGERTSAHPDGEPAEYLSDFNSASAYRKVSGFYPLYGRFLENTINILRVPNLDQAALAAGMFLAGGLQNNEQVALVSFEHPDQLLSRLAEAGLSLDGALHSEQLIYLYYKPDVANSLSLSVDYRELFREFSRLAGEGVKRLVLFNVDALINANSEHLVHTSLHQLVYAANHYPVTMLGLFVSTGQVGERLDEGCRAILPGYFVMDQTPLTGHPDQG